jgi:hypothetical protein
MLSMLTLAYVMFMGPISKGSYKAFQEDSFQEYSDNLILTVKSKIDNLFK